VRPALDLFLLLADQTCIARLLWICVKDVPDSYYILDSSCPRWDSQFPVFIWMFD